MLRYAPPIYTVIKIGIRFVFINILNILILLLLSIIIILLSSVISNVSYSSLRFAPSTV
jgi:accessory gene regulator protein AgrB